MNHEEQTKALLPCTFDKLGAASLPPVRDFKAPLPPVDKPFKTLSWREQIERGLYKPLPPARERKALPR